MCIAEEAVSSGILDRLPEGVSGGDWYMDYRNADGSIAQMCGNGVRVFAHYLRTSGLESRDQPALPSPPPPPPTPPPQRHPPPPPLTPPLPTPHHPPTPAPLTRRPPPPPPP